MRGVHSLHPFVQLLFYLGATALVMLYKHPVFLLVGAILLILFNLQLDKGRTLKSWFMMLLFISFFFLLINPLVNHRGTHILFYLNDNPVMLEAVLQGVIAGLTLFTLFILFASYQLVVTADRFLFLFAKWLPQWALLTMLSMRFVPLLRRRLTEIETVQKAKGSSVTEGRKKDRIKHGITIVQVLLTWSLEEAVQTADSMAARGYGLKNRSKYTPFKLKNYDIIAIIYLVSLASIGVLGWWLGDGVLMIEPVLETMKLQGREWFYLGAFSLYIGTPIIIQGREVILWHFWMRKM
ncbi:energy-coupling factor transporter transmembrane component T [Metabacillus sp. HB246100]